MPLFDLSGYVGLLANESITFTSHTETLVAGRPQYAANALGTYACSVQPIQGKNAQAELEAIQAINGVEIWVNADLPVAGQGVRGARFTWEGDTYEIRLKRNWDSSGTYQHYVAGQVTG